MTPPPPKPVVLCILDGWGLRDETEANAIALAKTPIYDRLRAETPHATLKTSGEDVGLTPGQMGNSEVGHMNIGAWRVVWMDLPKVDHAIETGALQKNQQLTDFTDKLRKSGGAAHILGLLSPGGVHAHQRHITAIAKHLDGRGVRVWLHLFLDGRDTPPTSAAAYLAAFDQDIAEAKNVRIATVSGRFYAMDRDNRWERIEAAWRAIALGDGVKVTTASDAITAGYERGETDEFVQPTVIGDYAGPAGSDGLFMANFRADRAREILSALLDPTFSAFDRGETAPLTTALGMVEYSEAHNAFMGAVFPQETIANTLGEWMAAQCKTQFRIAETEKYPHVTFFLNGGVETPNLGEFRHMAPSPRVATYDQQPEMSAAEVTAALTNAIQLRAYDLIVVNYANPDMVGHTGDLAAAIEAVETVDAGVGAAWSAITKAGGAMLVTADHGNCEQMVDPETGGPHTAHTTNPVPVFLIAPDDNRFNKVALRDGGRLADVAPTLLELMELSQPNEMTGRSLLVRKE